MLKIHQNDWRLRLCPRPHWGAYVAGKRGGEGDGLRDRAGE